MIGFYHEYDEYGCFSNWYPAEFEYAGRRFANSEQFMMYQKVAMFHRYDLAEQIMNTPDPATCKKIAGQKFQEFNPKTWDKTRKTVVKRGVRAKFQQNEDIRDILLGTGNELLAECSPRDIVWGIGIDIADQRRKNVSKWRGKNLLGRILMEVREELRIELAQSPRVKTEYIEAREMEPIKEWLMKPGELKRIPQFYNTIHAYSDTLDLDDERDAFLNNYNFYEWDIAMQVNMGGGLPIAGFYEMKQDIYDTVRRLNGGKLSYDD